MDASEAEVARSFQNARAQMAADIEVEAVRVIKVYLEQWKQGSFEAITISRRFSAQKVVDRVCQLLKPEHLYCQLEAKDSCVIYEDEEEE